MPAKAAFSSTRLNRSSLSEQAAVALRKLILRNVLTPGSSVTEREVSEQLGTSRTPAREAIRTLVQEGLINVSETGRLSVVKHDLDTVINLVRVLGALEGLAAELAATNANKATLRKIAESHEEMGQNVADKSDFKYFNKDIAFHAAIVAASENSALMQTHKLINDQLYQARFQSSRRQDRRELANVEHAAILEALQERNGTEAREAMLRHISSTIDNLRDYESA